MLLAHPSKVASALDMKLPTPDGTGAESLLSALYSLTPVVASLLECAELRRARHEDLYHLSDRERRGVKTFRLSNGFVVKSSVVVSDKAGATFVPHVIDYHKGMVTADITDAAGPITIAYASGFALPADTGTTDDVHEAEEYRAATGVPGFIEAAVLGLYSSWRKNMAASVKVSKEYGFLPAINAQTNAYIRRILYASYQRRRSGVVWPDSHELISFSPVNEPDSGLPFLSADDFLGSALRGVNGYQSNNPLPVQSFLDTLLRWNVNVCRVWLTTVWTGTDYEIDLQALARMEQHLQWLDANGIEAVLTLTALRAHAPWEPVRIPKFIDQWKRIATRYRTFRRVAFDLFNEPSVYDNLNVQPHEYPLVLTTWTTLTYALVSAIREITPERCIVWEAAFDAHGSQFGSNLPDLQNIVFSPHVYDPHTFTHQGVPQYLQGQPLEDLNEFTPGIADTLTGIYNTIQDSLAGKPILIGETSAARWAPNNGAAQYVQLSMSEAVRIGASVCYHEFYGDPVWDAEGPNSEDTTYTKSDTAPVASVLLPFFAENQRR